MPPIYSRKGPAHDSSKSNLCVLDETDYELKGKLGEGHFGSVLLVRKRSSKAFFAWKRFETASVVASARQGGRIIELLEREIQIHQRYAKLNDRFLKSLQSFVD